ncbi:MFS transporter [Streptosporangium amethystogenes]|uniref:MFS transporter n=1 Tax=Streptosporangium amethystogenes TaxID=2002 RepID=UPI0004C766F9|nr:MFS transporter [Streptosporangium amethystogenes]
MDQTVSRPPEIEMTVYAGRPPLRVRLNRAAPLGWWPAAVIALVSLVDKVEFYLVAGALPLIQAEFGFSDTWGGAISTASLVASTILLLPAGYLADTGRRTGLMAAVVGSWALLTLGSGLAPTFALFFGMRVLLGGASQLYSPPAASLIADYYPPGSRARAYGFERMAYFAGTPIGVVVGGAVGQAYGWRNMFFFVVIPGVLIAALCLTLREPIRGIGDRIGKAQNASGVPGPDAGAAADEVTGAATAEAAEKPRLREVIPQMRYVLTIRPVRLVFIGLGLLFFGISGIMWWLPTFMQRFNGLEVGAAAGIAGGSGLLGIVIGTLLGSRYGDRWQGRYRAWRITLSGGSLLAGTLCFAAAIGVPFLGARIAMFALTNAFFGAAIANLTAGLADLLPAERRGVGFAVLQFTLALSGALGPLLVGAVSDVFGSLLYAFTALLVPAAISGLVVLRARSSYDTGAVRT